MKKLLSVPREIIDPKKYDGEIGITNGKNNPIITTVDFETNQVSPVILDTTDPQYPVTAAKFKSIMSSEFFNLYNPLDLRIDLGDYLGVPKTEFNLTSKGLANVLKKDVVSTEVNNVMYLLKDREYSINYPDNVAPSRFTKGSDDYNRGRELPDDVVSSVGNTVLGEWLREMKESISRSVNKTTKKQGMEIYLYNTSERVIDVPSREVYVDLIKPGDDIYTDCLDIRNKFGSLVSPGLQGLLEVEVSYTWLDSIITHYSKFTAFKYPTNESADLEIPERLELIGGDKLVLEYFNGTLRLIKQHKDVHEYVITKCTLSYGQ